MAGFWHIRVTPKAPPLSWIESLLSTYAIESVQDFMDTLMMNFVECLALILGEIPKEKASYPPFQGGTGNLIELPKVGIVLIFQVMF